MAGKMFILCCGDPSRKKGGKGFSTLPVAYSFNYLKLKLRMELEERIVRKLLYKLILPGGGEHFPG